MGKGIFFVQKILEFVQKIIFFEQMQSEISPCLWRKKHKNPLYLPDDCCFLSGKRPKIKGKEYFTCCYVLYLNQFVFRNQYFHDNPSYQISYGTDTENNEVAGSFTFKSHECHVGFGSIVEQTS